MQLSSWLKLERWLSNTSMERQLYRSVPKSESESSSHGDPMPSEGWRRKWKWLWASLLALLAIIGVMSATLHFLSRKWMPSWSGVYPSYVDNEPKLLIEWQADPRFSRGNPQSKAAWDDLVPPGHGHMIVHEDEIAAHGLGKGKFIPGKGFAYAVSGFHQIHCLAMIREALFRLIEKPDVPLYSYGDPSKPALNLTAHLDHCFDYIRQGITCAADSTIESKHKKPGQSGPSPEDEGWGNVHICRSWSSLKEFVGSDDRRPTDLSGLSIDHYFQDSSHISK